MKSRPPRHAAGFSYVGRHRYSLTFCTYHRARVFTRAEAVELVIAQLLRAARAHDFSIPAYCFLPDHVHLLVAAESESSDCRAFIARARQYSGFYFSRAFKERLWQRYAWERTLRDKQQTIDLICYIVLNPVRHRVVARADDYPFIGSTVYSRAQMLSMCLDSHSGRVRL